MDIVYTSIQELTDYALQNKLIQKEDTIYYTNRIIAALQLDAFIPQQTKGSEKNLDVIFNTMFSEELKNHLDIQFSYQWEILRTEIMNLFTEKPSVVSQKFWEEMKDSPEQATLDFYQYCKTIDYIRDDSKNLKWSVDSAYGQIDLSINLSKPEKDPAEIALLLTKPQAKTQYPKCQLCVENEGYKGNSSHPARANLRLIPLKLYGKQWYFQFSPYGYYHQHSIVLNGEHVNMKIGAATFHRLLEFTDQFPHYFIGSNADLPIVGGSILNHDHFQAGVYEFPLMKASVSDEWEENGIVFQLLNWPVSTLRLVSYSKENLIRTVNDIFERWKNYSDEKQEIFAFSDGVPHNTITPVVRKTKAGYEFYVIFRNNRTSAEFPDGIFHPHPEFHHIKKENIGLIEAMGLAILPARLKTELKEVAEVLKGSSAISENIKKHQKWIEIMKEKYDFSTKTLHQTEEIIDEEVGRIFIKILENTGVFAGIDEMKNFLKETN